MSEGAPVYVAGHRGVAVSASSGSSKRSAIAAAVGCRIVYDVSTPDGAPRKLLDVSRLTAIGWAPRITLAAGIAATYG